MKKLSKTYLPVLAGALALAGITGTAEAQTTELNVGGSSAGRNYATDVPLNLCDAGTSTANYPNLYRSADNNRSTWVCNRAGLPVIIRYSATGSSDGVNKLLQPAANPASNMNFHDHTILTGCTGPVDTTRPSDGKHYNFYSGCSNGSTVSLPVHVGASDVGGASFHQVGPIGTSVSPLDDSTLNSVQAAVVPFGIFVGKGVVKLDAAGTAPAGQIDGISRLQLERIFSAQVTDWRQLGYGTVTDAAPGTLEASSPIIICQRNAGSGTKAAFDETLMINVAENSVALPTRVFSSSTSGVLACVAGNRRAIGYMDADQKVSFDGGGANAGLGYMISVDGGKPFDATLTDPKRDLKCGKWAYWAGWRLNRRTSSEGAAIDALRDAFVADASSAATISIIPTGVFWEAPGNMFVSKNADKGPLIFTAGAHPACR